MEYNSVEREAIGLCICLEAIDNVINHELLKIHEIACHPPESEVRFRSSVHQELFIIRVLDFVKEGGDKNLTGVSGSCLQVLRSACANCSFDQNDSISALRKSVDEFDEWLNNKKPISLWLPTLDLKANMEVSSLDLLSISGNHSKHNLSRLTFTSTRVHKILSGSGYSVLSKQIPLALEDLREHLMENYFVYYGTWIVELMNNIRWGLQAYLTPIYLQSYTKEIPGDIFYWYKCPSDIQGEVAKQWFWRLMNNIRTGPYLKRFVGNKYLKRKSSIELPN